MIWLILLIGLILRITSLNQSFWLDEAINVLAAKNYSFLGMITEYARADFHPPGWFMLLWFWTKFFGYSEIAVRIPSIIFGLLTIYIVYLIGQKLHSKNLGLFSALILAINPLHIYYSQEARMYAMATLAVSINIFLFIKLLKGDKVNYFSLILINFLILMSDYVAYFIFPAQFIFLLFFKRREILKRWLLALVSAAALSIWWIPIFLSQLDIGSIASAKLPAWKLIVGGFDYKTVPLTFIKFIIGRISYSDKLIYAVVLLPISALFLFLLWRGIKFIKGFGRSLILCWIFIPVLLATFASMIIPIYSYFRLLFILPGFLILIPLGILSFKSKIKYGFLVVVLLIELFSALIYLLKPLYQREDWRGLVNFLKPKENAVVLFESSDTLPPFDYYAKGQINTRGGLRNFPARNSNDVIDLENLSQNSKEIYLVDYLVEIADPSRLIAKKLDELNYKIVETKNFNGVGFIYHYVK